MRLLDRLTDRYRSDDQDLHYRQAQGFYEGMASGAAVMMTYGGDSDREGAADQRIALTCRQAYETNGVVFAVILARMMLFSEATFKLRSNVDKRLYGTTDLSILERPAPNQTTGELLARMEQDISLNGNAFIWKAADDLLVRLPPDEVIIVSARIHAPGGGTYRKVLGYAWEPKGNAPGTPQPETHVFLVEEIAHWSPLPDPAANFRGMSWLTPIVREIYADSGLTAYKTQYLDHAATPNMIVKYAQKLRPDTVDRVVERFRERFGGVSNAWQPIVLDQGSDATVVGNSLAQLDFKAVQGGGETRIASAGGVPPIIVGLSEGLAAATYSNYATAMRRFTDLTMRPQWRSVCAALEKVVPNIPPVGVRLWYDTSDIAALRQSEIEMAQVMQVHGATLLTMMQSGFTRESAVAAIIANDLSQLKPEAGVPPQGVHVTVASRESGTAQPGQEAVLPQIPGMPKTPGSAPPDQKTISSGKPQTAATKIPMPATMAGKPSNNGGRS